MKKIISVVLAALMLVSMFAISVSAEDGSVSVRIEGASNTIYVGTVGLEINDDTTVADVLKALVDSGSGVSITGLDTGYITEINGEKADQFSQPDDYVYDGWYYAVSDVVPSEGISSCIVSDGDEIVLFYGDYPCQFPVMDTNDYQNGKIKFESYDYVNGYMDTESNEWISEYDWCPVKNAVVYLNDDVYTTNDNGEITVEPTDYTGFVTVQISKTSSIGAPAVCRFASDYGFDADEENAQDETTEPLTEEPTTEEPTTAEPTTETPTTEEPTTEEPTTEAPVTEEPTTAEPTTEAPVTEEPTTAEPTTEAPVTEEPTTEAPTTEEPTTAEHTTEAPTTEKPTEGTVIKPTVTVTPSATFKFTKTLYVTGTFKFDYTSESKVKFTSSKKDVAKVDGKGNVTALKAGKATVTAKLGKIKIQYVVTVKNPTLNSAKFSLKKGKSFSLKVKGLIGKAKFVSVNKNIASVSSKGKIIAKKKGNAVIKVIANGFTLKCKVTVK